MTAPRDLIRHGWSSACDGLLALRWFSFAPSGRGTYRILTVRSEKREVEVCVSPTGRSVRIYVDGVEV